MKFNHTKVCLFIGSGPLILGCWGGLIQDPKPSEVFRDVYNHPAFDGFKWGPSLDKRPRNKQHIERITQALQNSKEGQFRLESMLVINICKIISYGKLDLEETWQKYMVDSRFTRAQTTSKFHQTSHHEQTLHHALHKWCKGDVVGGTRMLTDEEGLKLHISQTLMLQGSKVNQETVKLAIDFHTFVMAWQSSLVYESIAFTTVYFKMANRWPRGFGNKMLEKIFRAPRLNPPPKNHSYLSVLEILKIEHPHREEPIILEGPYNIHVVLLNYFSYFCRMLMEPPLHGNKVTEFWGRLNLALHKYGMDFVEEFREMHSYFKKGRPFDNSIQYYNVLSNVGNILKNKSRIESKLKSSSCSMKDSSGLQNSLQEPETHKIPLFRQVESMILYVEESLQHAMDKKTIPEFTAVTPRARKSQLTQIANLLCKHFLPITTKHTALTNYNLNVELEAHGFPSIINLAFGEITRLKMDSRDALKIAALSDIFKEVEQEFRRKYIALRLIVIKMNLELESNPSRLEEIKKEYSDKISKSLEECELQLMQNWDQMMVEKNKNTWEILRELTFNRLEPISLRDAERLIVLLKNGTRVLTAVPLFNHLDYCMKIEDETKRRKIFMDIGDRLRLLHGKMSEKELSGIHKVHEFNREMLDKVSYSTWKERIIYKIVNLETPASQVLDEIVLDASREQLLQDSSRKSLSETKSHGKIEEKFLSEEQKKQLDNLSDLWRINEVEYRILTGQI